MHFTVKLSCILILLLGVIWSAESFPQFSIPFVSWNKPTEENSRFPLNFRVQNPFSAPFGKNSNIRQYDRSRGNNEVLHKGEKLITVTPNYDYYTNYYGRITTVTQTTPSLLEATTNVKNIQGAGVEDSKREKILDSKITSKNNQERQVNNGIFNDGNNDITDITTDYDATTESTTEYESTTFDDSDLYRSGVSGHVVASLLG